MKQKFTKLAFALFVSIAIFTGCGQDTTSVTYHTQDETHDTTHNHSHHHHGTYSTVGTGEILNVYSSRHFYADQVLVDKFTEETGIGVNIIHASAGEIVERLRIEGENTKADLIIADDISILSTAKEMGILQPFYSEFINDTVPYNLKDYDNYWYSITKRARVIVYSKDRVNSGEITTYQDLAMPKWENRVLVRSSNSIYNQSLVASFVDIYGEEEATKWAQGISNNMARPPRGNDRDQIIAIASGEGDVAIVNTYYLALLLSSLHPEEIAAGQSVNIVFPNQNTTGTHINMSGVAIPKYASNKENAIKFIEFLLAVENQEFITNNNFEYPVNPNAQPSPLLNSWGTFNTQVVNFDELPKSYITGVQILNSVGW